MKKFILILLLLGGAGYAYWPYYSTGQFVNAVNNQDAKAVDAVVDWPLVHESLIGQMRAKADEALDEIRVKLGDPEKLKAVKAELDKALERGAEKFKKEFDSESLVQSAKKRPGMADLEKVELENRSWSSFNEFKAKTNMHDMGLKFRLQGASSWKLVEITFSEKTLKEMKDGWVAGFERSAAEAKRPGGQPGSTTPAGATPAGQSPPPKKEQWIFKDYQNPLDKKPAAGR
jgi:hypothetical protein